MNEKKEFTVKKERNTSIDLLKAIAMFMVVILHTITYGLADVEFVKASKIVCDVLQGVSIVAVNCFVLITGYFMCDTTKINWGRLLRLWIQVECFSIGMYMMMCVVPNTGITFNVTDLIRNAMPLLTNQYWFVTCYFLLCIIAPFLNVFINAVENDEYRKVLIILTILFSVIPSINIFGDQFGTKNGYSLIWFCILYLIAAYIRRMDNFISTTNIFFGIFLPLTVINIILRIVGDYVPEIIQVLIRNSAVAYNGSIVLIMSVALFEYALNKKTQMSSKVTKVASLSFGVYLWHEINNVREYIWNQAKLSNVADNWLLLLVKILGVAILVFTIGILMESIRRVVIYGGVIVQKLWNARLEK